MTTRCCRPLIAIALMGLYVPSAAAAPTTWADPLGVCNGEVPCFSTVGEAVANAGPPPATVFVFPGTYPESVDLGTMGSALPGGAPGAVSVVSVDAAGQPAPGATIDPGAPGGPGVGAAVLANAFPAPVTLDGLAVRSPDASGIELELGTGAVHLRRITADGSPNGRGISVGNASGDVAVEGCSAHLNGGAGIAATTMAGAATVTVSLAERNGLEGFVVAGGPIAVIGSIAEANDSGGFVLGSFSAGATLSLTSVEASLNGGAGVLAIPFVFPGSFAIAQIDGVIVTSNQGGGLGVEADAITAADIVATNNTGAGGAGFLGITVEVTGSTAEGNEFAGVAIEADEAMVSALTAVGNGDAGVWVAPHSPSARFTLTDVEATGNDAGIAAFGDLFAEGEISGATASGNQDLGVLAGADVLRLVDVTAIGNGGTGIVAAAADAHLTGCRAANNLTGMVMSGEQVSVVSSSATANGPSGGGTFDGNGFVLVDVDRAYVADNLALGNDFGWLILDLDASAAPPGLDAARARARAELERLTGRPLPFRARGGAPAPQKITIVTSRIEGSAGASMQVALRQQGTLSARCSDFVGNGSAGLALFTDNAVDARGSFWGDPTGPTHPGNPGGVGDAIHDAAAGFAGAVLYTPFLAGTAGAGDCRLPGEALEVPTLDGAGLFGLALALALAARWRLRRPA